VAIVINGIRIRRLRSPGATSVRRVISKFVNEIVVLIPANTTLNSNTSCAPTPVNLVCEERGAIKVHPEVVNARFEHLVKYTLRRRALDTLSARYQKCSGT
jgi:hypothetical protein